MPPKRSSSARRVFVAKSSAPRRATLPSAGQAPAAPPAAAPPAAAAGPGDAGGGGAPGAAKLSAVLRVAPRTRCVSSTAEATVPPLAPAPAAGSDPLPPAPAAATADAGDRVAGACSRGGWGRISLPSLPAIAPAPPPPPSPPRPAPRPPIAAAGGGRHAAALRRSAGPAQLVWRRGDAAILHPTPSPSPDPAGAAAAPEWSHLLPDDVLREYLLPYLPLRSLLSVQRVCRQWRAAARAGGAKLKAAALAALRNDAEGLLRQCKHACDTPCAGFNRSLPLSARLSAWLHRTETVASLHEQCTEAATKRDLVFYLERCVETPGAAGPLADLHAQLIVCRSLALRLRPLEQHAAELDAARAQQQEDPAAVTVTSAAGARLYTAVLPAVAGALEEWRDLDSAERVGWTQPLPPVLPGGCPTTLVAAAKVEAQRTANSLIVDCAAAVIAAIQASYSPVGELLALPPATASAALLRAGRGIGQWEHGVLDPLCEDGGSPTARAVPLRRELRRARAVLDELRDLVAHWNRLLHGTPALSDEEIAQARELVLQPVAEMEQKRKYSGFMINHYGHFGRVREKALSQMRGAWMMIEAAREGRRMHRRWEASLNRCFADPDL